MFDRIIDTVGDIGLSAIRRITDLWRSGKAKSLVEYTAPSRVEPICLVDMDCAYVDELHDLMQTLQSLFSAYWLQAFTLSLNVGRIDVMRQLDKLNPKRNITDSAVDAAGGAVNWLNSLESYKYRLPTLANRAAMEAEIIDEGATGLVSRDTLLSVKEMTNLSVGKQLSVEVSDGCNRGTILVSIRLLVSSILTSDLIHILSVGNKDVTANQRRHAWKAGRLEMIGDIIFGRDLIRAHRKNLMKDKTGLYSEILERRKKNKISALVSGNPSVATASNILVVSTETIQALEGETGLDFSDLKDREKLLDETGVMIAAVVDKNWSRVKIYTDGIKHPTDLALRDLKSVSKGSGPDVSEILKAYQLGNSPRL